MADILTTLKTGSRAAIVALALGAVALPALPAMAQSEPSFSFQLGIGGPNGGSVQFGVGNGGGRVIVPDHNNDRYCLNDRQLRRELRDEGFDDVQITRDLGRNRVEVVASYGRGWYKLRVNRCTGDVRIVERIKRSRPGKPSIGLQFNFSDY